MKVLLLGVGYQGKAVLYDLVHSEEVEEIIAADRDFKMLRQHISNQKYGDKVRCEYFDIEDLERLTRLMRQEPDVVIDLLPPSCHAMVAKEAIEAGVHVVNTSYVQPDITALANEALSKGVTILPEFGMDPGIDLVLLGEAVRSLDTVEELVSYGAGFPEPEAANNLLKYKVTWSFEGVLKSYHRPARVIRDGQIVEIQDSEVFCPENVHEVEVEGLGKLEAYPNGDAPTYAKLLGIDTSGLKSMGRYVLRWPGHAAFWKAMVDLHLLDEEPVTVDSIAVDRKRFLAAVMAPHIQYGAHERDVVVVRVEARGLKKGRKIHVIFQLIDRRDLETGHTAMSRTVGYTASIGAQMIGSGKIVKRGLLSPALDISYDSLTEELGKRNIRITSEIATCEGSGEPRRIGGPLSQS